jgi:hypothetical protein
MNDCPAKPLEEVPPGFKQFFHPNPDEERECKDIWGDKIKTSPSTNHPFKP